MMILTVHFRILKAEEIGFIFKKFWVIIIETFKLMKELSNNNCKKIIKILLFILLFTVKNIDRLTT